MSRCWRNGVVFCAGQLFLAFAAIAQMQPATNNDEIPLRQCQTIEISGTYRLASNLPGSLGFLDEIPSAGSPAGSCFVLLVPAVLDLAGFTLTGGGSGVGIYSPAEVGGAVVRNGIIRNFDIGVQIFGHGNTVSHVKAFDNSAGGIMTFGFGHIIENNIALRNGVGIVGGDGSRLEGNIADSNTGNGIRLKFYDTALNNIAVRNGGAGIFADGANILKGNSVSNNASVGIRAGTGSTVIQNTATVNDSGGITVSCPSLVDENTSYNNNGINLDFDGACPVGNNAGQ